MLNFFREIVVTSVGALAFGFGQHLKMVGGYFAACARPTRFVWLNCHEACMHAWAQEVLLLAATPTIPAIPSKVEYFAHGAL